MGLRFVFLLDVHDMQEPVDDRGKKDRCGTEKYDSAKQGIEAGK